MDVREELLKLPQPDPRGVDRVWSRFVEDRRKRRRAVPWVGMLVAGGLVAAAAVVALGVSMSDAHRTLDVDVSTEASAWSSVVELEPQGRGVVAGTDRNVEINWEAGTITAHVTPNSGTQLAVVTDEARVEVVGTIFSVTRDRLGATTSVAKGKVKVTCDDGWDGFVTPESGPHTCLPTRPALLLSRADALSDGGASPAEVLETVERGLKVAERSDPARGELIVRRMHLHGGQGRVSQSLADADAYLASGAATRRSEVQRYAGWLAMGSKGCERARPYLEDLGNAREPNDMVLLGECVAADDSKLARELLNNALSSGLDASWTARARTALTALGER